MFLCRCEFLTHLSTWVGVSLLNCMLNLYYFCKNCQTILQSSYTFFKKPEMSKGSCSTSSQWLDIVGVLILVGVVCFSKCISYYCVMLNIFVCLFDVYLFISFAYYLLDSLFYFPLMSTQFFQFKLQIVPLKINWPLMNPCKYFLLSIKPVPWSDSFFLGFLDRLAFSSV